MTGLGKRKLERGTACSAHPKCAVQANSKLTLYPVIEAFDSPVIFYHGFGCHCDS